MQSAPPAGGSASSSLSPCLALVPLVQEAASQRPSVALFEQQRLQRTLATVDPQEKKAATKIEAGVLQSCLRLMSKSELASKLKCSRQTVTRRLRLLSFCILMVREAWALEDFKNFDNWLHYNFGDGNVRRMNFLGKSNLMK